MTQVNHQKSAMQIKTSLTIGNPVWERPQVLPAGGVEETRGVSPDGANQRGGLRHLVKVGLSRPSAHQHLPAPAHGEHQPRPGPPLTPGRVTGTHRLCFNTILSHSLSLKKVNFASSSLKAKLAVNTDFFSQFASKVKDFV